MARKEKFKRDRHQDTPRKNILKEERERNCNNGEGVFWFAKLKDFLPDRGEVIEESEIKQSPQRDLNH